MTVVLSHTAKTKHDVDGMFHITGIILILPSQRRVRLNLCARVRAHVRMHLRVYMRVRVQMRVIFFFFGLFFKKNVMCT